MDLIKRHIRKFLIAIGLLGVASAATVGDIGSQPDFAQMSEPAQMAIEQNVPDAGNAEVVVNEKRPEATLKKWNGEANMKVSVPSVQGKGRRNGNRFRYGQGNEQVRMRELDDGFKIDVVWQSKPPKNSVTFQLENTDNLNFFYQEPLDEEMASSTCTPTDCGDAHRPENVVGSYAVYHKSKKDHVEGQTNYATGKAYHIYRPKIIDDAGNETWGELLYSNGEMAVTVPQSFLERASYPVIIDPTFGYTTAGASEADIGAKPASQDQTYTRGSQFNVSESFTITDITFNVKTLSDSAGVNAGIYPTNGSQSANLLYETDVVNVTSTGWATTSTSTAMQESSGDYWILSQYNTSGDGLNNSGGQITMAYDSGTTDKGFLNGAPFGGRSSMPDPMDDSGGGSITTEDREYSIYATYTATAGEEPQPKQSEYFF